MTISNGHHLHHIGHHVHLAAKHRPKAGHPNLVLLKDNHGYNGNQTTTMGVINGDLQKQLAMDTKPKS